MLVLRCDVIIDVVPFLVYYSKIDTIVMESISPIQPTRSYKLQTDVYDTQTGENRWSARKTCTIAGFGDGEKYLHNLIDSFIRGLRRGEQVELHINAKKTECIVPDLFPNVY